MKPTKPRLWIAVLVASMSCVLGVPARAAEQESPPINGVTGTVALEGTVVQEQAAANTVIVKTVVGVEHLLHYTKELLFHGGKSGGVEALQGLRDGTTVAVHYAVAGSDAATLESDQIGDEGLSATEGTVVRIDRGRKQITIRFDSGESETFQLAERPAFGAGRELDHAPDEAASVTVYYTDEDGRSVVHSFKQAS